MTVKDNASRIAWIESMLQEKMPSHEDLKEIVDEFEGRLSEVYDKIEHLLNYDEKLRVDLVTFKRDCGQDILQAKRKIASLEREVFKDRSRY